MTCFWDKFWILEWLFFWMEGVEFTGKLPTFALTRFNCDTCHTPFKVSYLLQNLESLHWDSPPWCIMWMHWIPPSIFGNYTAVKKVRGQMRIQNMAWKSKARALPNHWEEQVAQFYKSRPKFTIFCGWQKQANFI